MIETIKAVLSEFGNANLESESCREKIAEEIKKELTRWFIVKILKIPDIRKIKAWEKDNE